LTRDEHLGARRSGDKEKAFNVIKALLLRQQSQYFLTLPVALGIGISTYFGLRSEPAWWVAALLLCSIAVLICLALVRIAPRALILLAMMLIGFSVAWFNAETSGAPKLNWRYYGPISGIVVKVDRSQSDKTRITLAQVYLSRFDQSKTPKYLRVALHGLADFRTYSIGEHVALTGHLQARQGPVEPGGYDFRRRAWFDQLGGVGYTRSPAVLIAKPAYGSISQYIDRIRQDLARHLRQNLSEHGDFAAAILVGDRSQLDQLAVDSLRRSNLAHLLAISGLHMAIVTGTIFAGLRLAIAAIPYIALRINSKKLAATYAIAAGFIYLFLSGANVPAARAFIMVAVMYTAMLLDRRAISLRSVAISAIIILLLRPQELLEPGFQMSFAATTALVTVFVSLSRTRLLRFNPIGSFILTLMLSSFVAGAATAPFSAFHFNQFSNFGLLANILSVPLMGAVVM
jgi:competence protein ComEC